LLLFAESSATPETASESASQVPQLFDCKAKAFDDTVGPSNQAERAQFVPLPHSQRELNIRAKRLHKCVTVLT
jgi:hypothetical protein